MPSRQPPPPPDVLVRRRYVPIAAVIAAAAACVLAAAAAAVFIFFLWRRRRRRRRKDAEAGPESSLRRFSFNQLRRAAGSLSPSHRIGQGGFGPVFRGSLANGEEIAVKLMDSGSLQGEREFENELFIAQRISTHLSPGRQWVLPAVGFCYSTPKKSPWWRRWRKMKRKGSGEVAGAGDDDEEGLSRRILLVYELMSNGSLQDALLDRKCREMKEWSRRFAVALDIARGLEFLHFACDPPIVHGDVKPSNVLLGSDFSARIADFGLARLKTNIIEEEDAAPDIEIEGDETNAAAPAANRTNDEDGSVAPESPATAMADLDRPIEEEEEEESSARAAAVEMLSPGECSRSMEVASTSETAGIDGTTSFDSGIRKAGRRGGKDWWWRQDSGDGDGGGGRGNSEPSSSVKDYVMEWIRVEIKKENRPKSDSGTPPAAAESLRNPSGRAGRKKKKKLEWWASLDEDRLNNRNAGGRRPARKWWREEFCDELTNKQRGIPAAAERMSSPHGAVRRWRPTADADSSSFEAAATTTRMMMKKNGNAGSRECGTTSSGDVQRSSTFGSTPSMRGTVCYVAPECGGGGPLSEKCDIYSFGVLLLVLVAGRRPLQVVASPMSEFERANLISWARHLAHSGKLLDLVDSSLVELNADQALLCITIALLCIQRSPVRRPSSKEIVAMLSHQMDPPALPLEFSPSPPAGFSFRSRRKAKLT